MKWEDLVRFEKKPVDWWILTLLPLLIILALSFFNFITVGSYPALSTFIEETLIFAIVLSSTDLAIRYRIAKEDKHSRLTPLVILILAIFIVLIYSIAFNTIIAKFSESITYVAFTIVTIVVGYASINLYNNNPESGPDYDPVEQKMESEKKDIKEFESKV